MRLEPARQPNKAVPSPRETRKSAHHADAPGPIAEHQLSSNASEAESSRAASQALSWSGALDASAIDRRAQHAASAHTWALCDEIDRTQQHLNELRVQLEGTIALCTSVFDNRCERQDIDTLARAQRVLDELAK